MLPNPSTSLAVRRAIGVAVARGLNADNPSVGAAMTRTPPIVSISPRPRAGAAVRMSRLVIAVLVAAALLGVIRVGAAGMEVGVRDFSDSDLNAVQVPTEDKPQGRRRFRDAVRAITARQTGNDKPLRISRYADNIEALLP